MSRVAVYPGTFDPIHFGHVDIATRAARVFDQLVVAVFERPAKTPLFSATERVKLARQALAGLPNVRVTPYKELTVTFALQIGAQAIIRGLRITDFELEYQMALANRQLEPNVEVVCLMTHQTYAFLSSSILKEIALLGGDVSEMTPPNVVATLEKKRKEQDRDRTPVPLVSLRD